MKQLTGQEKALMDSMCLASNKHKRQPIPGGSFRISKDDFRGGAVVAPTVFSTQGPANAVPTSPDKNTLLNNHGSKANMRQILLTQEPEIIMKR